jgi:ArsR family transcriptional regulator
MKDDAQFFKILADETRLKMLWLFFNHDELCVCDIMATLKITQSKASRHLSTMKKAGLVEGRKEGLWSYYMLRPVSNKFIQEHLDLLKTGLAKRPDAGALNASLDAWLKAKTKGDICATRLAVLSMTDKPKKIGMKSKRR